MSKRIKKVFIISTSFKGGGAEIVARDMFTFFNNLKAFRATSILFDCANNNSYRSICLNQIFSGSDYLSRLAQNVARYIRIQSIVKKEKPDFIFSHLELPNIVNCLLFTKAKKVLYVHNSPDKNYKKQTLKHLFIKLLIRLLYKSAFHIVAVAPSIKNELAEKYNISSSRVSFIKNPINISLVNSLSEQKVKYETLLACNYIVCVASLTTQKNYKLLLKIFSHVSKIDASVKLLILGAGVEKENLIHYCKLLKLSFYDSSPTSEVAPLDRSVYFLGHVDNPYPYIKKSKLLASTSKWEGLPISFLEAMCLGKNIFTSYSSDSLLALLEIKNLGSGKGYDESNLAFMFDLGRVVDDDFIKLISYKLYEYCLRGGSTNDIAIRKTVAYDIRTVGREWRGIIEIEHV
jgi:glycosyltransferase involved in cell wall biosynthesis